MKALPADVQRIIGWDELPASVRELPTDVDPTEDGVFMKHQIEWLALCEAEDLTICEKGRRTGITYATGLDSAITISTQRKHGGDNVYYVGDTHDKGLEFIGYVAHMLKVMAVAMADGFMGVELFLFKDQQPDGSTKNITAYRIRTAAGFQAVALSSNPANIRGLQGIVVIDEAAFHRNVAAVIDAATALIIWGGKVRIISTHDGDANPFNQLVKDSYAGSSGFKVFRCSFDDAVENGLYERVCLVKGWDATAEGKEAWYKKIRSGYGTNRAAMLQELDVVPAEGSGVAISGVLIEKCMPEKRPVIRLELDDDFALKSLDERNSWCEAWIDIHVKPIVEALDPDRQHCLGEDYARYSDFTVYAPAYLADDLTRVVPFLVELNNVPTAQQEQILWFILDRLPNFFGASMDGTGNGFGLAERTQDKYGAELIHVIKLSDAWYRENMPGFTQAFEDQTINIPKDTSTKNDIRGLQRILGIVKPGTVRKKDVDNGKIKRHCDSAIALCMMWHASQQDIEIFAYESVKASAAGQDNYRDISTTTGFNGMRGIL